MGLEGAPWVSLRGWTTRWWCSPKPIPGLNLFNGAGLATPLPNPAPNAAPGIGLGNALPAPSPSSPVITRSFLTSSTRPCQHHPWNMVIARSASSCEANKTVPWPRERLSIGLFVCMTRQCRRSRTITSEWVQNTRNKKSQLGSAYKTPTSFFPTPQQVAGTDTATLRTAGLSARKAEYG